VAGWYVTEIGRQPFIVFGLLRTAEVASTVPAPMIALTLALYCHRLLALLVAYVGVLKYMAEKPVDMPATRGACPRPNAGPVEGGRMTFDERAAGHLHGADGRVDAGLRGAATATTWAWAC
jgi:hypothetical protein